MSFFITARYAGQSDRAAFVDVLLEQLSELLGEPLPAYLTESTREVHLLAMLAEAAELCDRRGERLVLVVDGLDEDRGVTVGPDAHSIAALLPARPPAGLRIVVAGRPNPPIPTDVPFGHPLHAESSGWKLTISPHAEVVRQDAQRELKQLLHGTVAEQDLLGLLTAAGGGLSGMDLSELTGWTDWEVEEHLQSVAGRTFARHNARWSPATQVYLLGHEELQQAAIRFLGPKRIESYQHRLHTWADSYRARGWPPDTPEYLLRGYYRLLRATGDLPRMLDCATDRSRHNRMLGITGGDSTALLEITRAQDSIAAHANPDLTAMGRLAVHRTALMERNTNIPIGLPAVWARMGHNARGEALAYSIAEQDQQAKALAELARAANEIGDVEQAGVLIEDAEGRADTITDHYEQTWTLIGIGEVAAEVGRSELARVLVERAETMASSFADLEEQARALAEVARVAAAAGSFDRAEAIASSITQSFSEASALVQVARRAAEASNIERAVALINRAEALAASMTDPYQRAQVLAFIGRAAAATGDLDWAYTLIQQADAFASSVTFPLERLWALSLIACTSANIGNVSKAESVAKSIFELCTQESIIDLNSEARVLCAIARAYVNQGDLDSARATAERVETIVCAQVVGIDRAPALSDVALVVAESGNIDQARRLAEEAERAARSNTSPYRWTRLLTRVAVATAEAGDFGRAHALTEQAKEVALTTADSFQLSRLLRDISVATAEIGSIDQAEAIVDLIAEPFEQAWALAGIAREAAWAGDSDRALGLTERAETIARSRIKPETQDRALGNVAEAIAEAGNFDRAEAISNSLADPFQRAWALIDVGEVAAQADDTDRARTLADRAEEISHSIGDRYDRARLMVDIARVVSAIGNLDRGQVIADSITEPSEQAEALAYVAEAIAHAGDPERARALNERAESVARTLIEIDEQEKALAHAARVEIAAGNLERAEEIACSLRVPSQQATALEALTAQVETGRAQRLIAELLQTPSWDTCLLTLAGFHPSSLQAIADELLNTQAETGVHGTASR
ncbi:hypothetical protein ACNAW0_18885 [Micromonospora sp. SL1-18]|uniref:hypothetical protein n=1 Tax=Micromonospora sp. SL1-18 TaxID=3399128 RepID=UPI003A4E5952